MMTSLKMSTHRIAIATAMLLLFSIFAVFAECRPTSWRIEHLFVDDLSLDLQSQRRGSANYDSDNDVAKDVTAPSTDALMMSPTDVEDPTPMLFKCVGHCDREGLTTGSRIIIEDSKWASINNREFLVEATSGWFFVYEDASKSVASTVKPNPKNQFEICGMPAGSVPIAVRPTEEEYHSIFDNNEKGYLKGGAGKFKLVH